MFSFISAPSLLPLSLSHMPIDSKVPSNDKATSNDEGEIEILSLLLVNVSSVSYLVCSFEIK